MEMELKVYTAEWTPEDIAQGANDPEQTKSETETFTDPDDVIEFLRNNGITEPSQYPIVKGSNVTGVWFSETDPYEHPYTGTRYERTVHRGGGITDETWATIVHLVTGT